MAMKAAKVPGDEMQDFLTLCADAGHDPTQFVVTAREDVLPNVQHIKRVVTVSRMRPNLISSQDFEASSGQPMWVATAIDALKAGQFGKP